MIELENPLSVSSLSALLEAAHSGMADGFGTVLCGCLLDSFPLMPFLPAPCSPSLAFGGKFLPLPAYIWTWSCHLAAWLTLFLWCAPVSVLNSMLWARVLWEGGSFSVLQAPAWERQCQVSQPPASSGEADKKKISQDFLSASANAFRLLMLLLPQFALQCGTLMQVRGDNPAEGRVVIKEHVSGLLSQDSSVKAVLIHRVQYKSFL